MILKLVKFVKYYYNDVNYIYIIVYVIISDV